MKQLLASFTHYEYWANERLLKVIRSLTEAQQQQEIVSSFASVHKTCLHVWDATSIWWQRLHKVSEVAVPSLSFHPSMEDIERELLQQNMKWIEWVRAATDEDLSYVLPYKNMKGEAFEQEVKEIVLHINNHGTYHRGQLVTMLRQLGVEKIPQTDYILYSRS
ncbi:MAG: DinB family protein [Sediminibacterium sp.]